MQTPSRSRTISRPLFFCATQLALAGLLAMAIPGVAAASSANEFQACAAELLRAGIVREAASVGCTEALHPQELSYCVLAIKNWTGIAGINALNTCARTRRPQELAACAIDIYRRIPNVVAPNAMAYCSRSLLPIRFAECVVGYHREMDISAPRAMEACIDARDYPNDLSPTFVQPQQLPVQPQPAPLAPFTPGASSAI